MAAGELPSTTCRHREHDVIGELRGVFLRIAGCVRRMGAPGIRGEHGSFTRAPHALTHIMDCLDLLARHARTRHILRAHGLKYIELMDDKSFLSSV